MKKMKLTVIACLSFSLGVIFGVLLSPVKGGFGNNAGNTSTTNYYVMDKGDR